MILEKSNIKYTVISSLLELGIIAAYLFDDPNGKVIVTLNFILTILFLIKFRKSIAIFILFCFFVLYNYATIQVFYDNYFVSAFKSFREHDWINKTFFIHSFFIFTIGNTIKRKNLKVKINLDIEAFKSKYLFWILVVLGLLMIQFGIQGENMLVSGGYGVGATKSSMHEYFILLYFLIMLVCPRKNTICQLVLIALYFIYCFKTVLFGGRVEAMEITLLLLIYYWLFPKKEKKSVLFGVLFIAAYANMVVSRVRNNPLLFIHGEYADYFNPFYSEVNPYVKIKYLGNNQGDVIQASNRILALINYGHFDVETRIKSFFGMLGSIVVPTTVLPDYVNLAAYYQTGIFRSGGGGLVSIYFYAWMGLFGPIFIGFFLGYFINKGFKPESNIVFKIYAIILITMAPRWFAYGPIIIFKFCLLTALMYLFSKYIFEIFLKTKSEELVINK